MPPKLHVPVLREEVIRWLDPHAGQVIVDGTLGGGGHARLLAERVGPNGRVIALDRDPDAVAACTAELATQGVTAVHASFADLANVLAHLEIELVDGVLLDLGVSSDQLADTERGFSFDATGPLDMRFDRTRGEPAWRLVNRLSEQHLADLIYKYGEERASRRIARAIVQARTRQPIKTATELATLVRRVVRSPRHAQRIDAATRTFQALRIAVNDELAALDTALARTADCLRPAGRFAVISFHSLEDRRVKERFRDDPRYESLTRKPIRPTADEIARNPRSRSAKMRVARRVENA